MLTDDDIRSGWLFILGREPEGDHVYEIHRHYRDIAALRDVLLRSLEFRDKFARVAKPTGYLRYSTNPSPPATVSPEVLDSMLNRIQGQWAALGESEPYWSVLTSPRYRSDAIEANKAEFFQTGLGDVRAIGAALARNRLVSKTDGVCVELGCGVGRVSVHLTKHFARVVGYDISPGNLRHAHANAQAHQINSFTGHLIKEIGDYDKIEKFDFFFSSIVLQHNPPPVQKLLLDKIMKRAKKDAILYFQVATYCASYRFDVVQYLDSPSLDLEMHVLSQSDVFDAISRGGCRLVEVMEDTATGQPDWISMSFLAQKR